MVIPVAVATHGSGIKPKCDPVIYILGVFLLLQVQDLGLNENGQRTEWEIQDAYFEGRDRFALKSCRFNTYLSASRTPFEGSRWVALKSKARLRLF